MRLLTLLFTLLLCTCGRAQTIVNLSDTTYAAVTIVTEETDDLTRTISDTLFLGSIAYVHEYAQRGRNQLRREFNRISLRIYALRAERADRQWLRLAEDYGYSLDSITNDRLIGQVLPDTFTISIPATLIPAALIGEYLAAGTPVADTYTVTLARFVNNRGRHRVRAVGGSGSWGVNVNSEDDFDLVNLFGPGTTVNLLKVREGRRGALFLDRKGIAGGSGDFVTANTRPIR